MGGGDPFNHHIGPKRLTYVAGKSNLQCLWAGTFWDLLFCFVYIHWVCVVMFDQTDIREWLFGATARPLLFNHFGTRSSGCRVYKSLLSANHLYQACSSPILCKILVGISQLSVPRKIQDLLRFWKIKWAKLTVEATPTWGRSQHKKVCSGEIFFYQFTTFLYLLEKYGWVQQRHFRLPKHHIRICRAVSTLVLPIVRNLLCSHNSRPARFDVLQHL